jgi:TRAP-type mannitol/chloroaromatic compound transport system substrate-binding protein
VSACHDLTVHNVAYGESVEMEAIERMKKEGVQVHYWPNQFLDAYKKGTEEVLAEESAKDPDFKKIYEHLKAYRAKYQQWLKLSRLPAGY